MSSLTSCIFPPTDVGTTRHNIRVAADQPKVEVKVEYEESKKFALQEQVLRHMGLLEGIAAHAADRFAWPKPWSIEARSCGEPNAKWSQRKLTLCYELASYFIELFVGYSGKLPRKLRALR